MLLSEFKFLANFSPLTQTELDDAYDEVTTMFYGVSEFWSSMTTTIREKKISLCYNNLTAWYLANKYPSRLRGVDADGRPLTSKSIGGVSLSFAQGTGQDSLMILTSNPFGLAAKAMIESCPERMGVLR